MFRRSISWSSLRFEEKTKQETNKIDGNLSLVTCVGFFIDLHFDSEDGGHIFLRNMGFFPNYKRDNPEDRILHSQAVGP
jgi:hypothetical protein